jgi:hypothetical protein
MAGNDNKAGFTLEAVKTDFNISKAEDSIAIQSYWIIDNKEYSEVYDVAEDNVKHHLDVRYCAAIRGQSVQQYAQDDINGLTGLPQVEAATFYQEVFGLELI